MAQEAGDFELHVWCSPDGSGERQWLTGSPFTVRVSGVRASPSGSFLAGSEQYMADAEEADISAMPSSATAAETSPNSPNSPGSPSFLARQHSRMRPESPPARVRLPKLAAGERLVLQPHLRDEYGNASFAADDALIAVVATPDHGEHPMSIKQLTGLGLYEVAYDVTLKGLHTVHVRLDGVDITGSPFVFTVTTGAPVGSKSRIIRPSTAPMVNAPCTITLETVDTYGNTLDVGGASVGARALGTGVSPCEVVDNQDGTYQVTFTSTVVGECRVIVRLDNKEMQPVTLNFEKRGGGSSNPKGEVGGEPEVAAPSIDLMPAQEPDGEVQDAQ